MKIAKGASEGAPARSPAIEDAVEAVRAGEMIIVVDDEDRENEGDLTIAAEKVTPEAINFMARYGRGLICLSMTPERLDELEIPLMVSREHVAVRDRVLRADRSEGPDDAPAFRPPIARRRCWRRSIRRPGRRTWRGPGHMFPLRSRTGGVLVRAGQTEAAVDLARIAGLYPGRRDLRNHERGRHDGAGAELTKFAKKHGLLMITIADLIKYRMRTESLVKRVASAKLPTELRRLPRPRVRERRSTSRPTSRWCCGDIGDGKDVLVRVHSQCLTGDVLHSIRCDCGAQLDAAMERIAAEGRGVLLYLNQEGRGIGLANKIRAYELQDEGFDTVEANERLGFKADQRDYGMGVQILRELGVRSMRLLSNNPRKLVGIEGYGLSVSEWLPLEIPRLRLDPPLPEDEEGQARTQALVGLKLVIWSSGHLVIESIDCRSMTN